MTKELIDSELAIDFSPTFETRAQNNKLFTWNNKFKLSDYFRCNNLYILYKSFLKNNDYTILFKDGSLIQLTYEFDSRERNLIKHRLFFLHFPFLKDDIDKQIAPLDYLESFETQDVDRFFQIEKFESIGFIRFDYDPNASQNSETPHPICHLTINKEGVTAAEKASRLTLCQATAKTLNLGLSLLGIETLERM